MKLCRIGKQMITCLRLGLPLRVEAQSSKTSSRYFCGKILEKPTGVTGHF